MTKTKISSLERRIANIGRKHRYLNLNVGEVSLPTSDESEEHKHNMHIFESKKFDPEKPYITIAAGVHGDEPDGITGVLEFLERNSDNQELMSMANYTIIPMVNLQAIEQGQRNVDGDIGRQFGKKHQDDPVLRMVERIVGDRPVDFFVDVHRERFKGVCFYVQEQTYKRGRKKVELPQIPEMIVKDLKQKSMKIYSGRGNNLGGTLRSQGVIQTDAREKGTFESYMYRNGAAVSMTLEYPAGLKRCDTRRKYVYVPLESGIRHFAGLFPEYKDVIRKR